MTQTNAQTFTVRDIASLVGGRFTGTEEQARAQVHGIAAIANAPAQCVTWLVDARHAADLPSCRAAAVIGNEATLAGFPRAVICDDPQWAVAKVLRLYAPAPAAPPPGVHPSAVVHATATLGQDVAIGALVVIKERAVIGTGTIIHPGVSIGADVQVGGQCTLFDRCVVYDRCRLGNRVILHSGAVIGADGFGYIFRGGEHVKLAHLGTVDIEDDVEIGANSCVDRAKVGVTRIGRGCKIDNLVMIAHNVEIGPGSVIIAQCGIAGSAKIGAGVVMGGQVGISHNIEIGDRVQIGGGSAVFENVSPRERVMGYPARPVREFLRNQTRINTVDELEARVAELEKRFSSPERPGG